MTFMMWWSLNLTLIVSFFMVVERVGFLCCTQLANELQLRRAVGQWRATSKWQPHQRSELGWLSNIIEQAPEDVGRQFLLVEAALRRASRFRAGMITSREIAMGIGLWGTFWGFISSQSQGDVTAMVAVGVGSSIYGLSISLGLYLSYGVLGSRLQRLRRQMELVAEYMEASLLDPASYRPVTPTAPIDAVKSCRANPVTHMPSPKVRTAPRSHDSETLIDAALIESVANHQLLRMQNDRPLPPHGD